MSEKTRDELAQELAQAYEDLEESDAERMLVTAALHACLRRSGGSLTFAPGELEEDCEIAIGQAADSEAMIAYIPGESAVEA